MPKEPVNTKENSVVRNGGGRCTVRIEDKAHPISAPMEACEIDDEAYRNQCYPGFQLHSLAHMGRENRDRPP